jgi:hypothetical protein
MPHFSWFIFVLDDCLDDPEDLSLLKSTISGFQLKAVLSITFTARATSCLYKGILAAEYTPHGSMSALPSEIRPTRWRHFDRECLVISTMGNTTWFHHFDFSLLSHSLLVKQAVSSAIPYLVPTLPNFPTVRMVPGSESDIIPCQATNARRGVSVTKYKRNDWRAKAVTQEHRSPTANRSRMYY